MAEIIASSEVAKTLGMEHFILTVDCSLLGAGNMTDVGQISISPSPEWWPYRNQLLITLSAMKAVQLDVDELILGTVFTDRLHADGRKQFYETIDYLMHIQEGAIRISAPAIDMTTEELISISGVPESLLLWAHSCHISNAPCGKCRGCTKYREVRANLGIE